MDKLNKKLHILFLCGWYPSRVFPNNGDFIQRHAEAVSLLHKVSVLHIVSDENCQQKIMPFYENINGVDTHIAYVKPNKNPLIKAVRFYKAFKLLLKKIDAFDVVHLNKIYPFGLYLFLLRKPFIISEHWTGYHNPQVKKIDFWQYFLTKKIVKKACFVCPVSKELQKSMENFGLKGTYNIIPNVVNTDIFFPSNTHKNNTFTIVHISNMNDNHKNVSGIIKAVSQLDFNYKLILIGENSSKYKTVSDTLQISANIDFIDHVSHTEIPKFLHKASVYISFSNYETWGIVMMEALACGVPVISTNTGIINELNKTEFAQIIPIKDEIGLAKAITKIKNGKMIAKNRMHHFVKANYSNNIIAKKFTQLYIKSYY